MKSNSPQKIHNRLITVKINLQQNKTSLHLVCSANISSVKSLSIRNVTILLFNFFENTSVGKCSFVSTTNQRWILITNQLLLRGTRGIYLSKSFIIYIFLYLLGRWGIHWTSVSEACGEVSNGEVPETFLPTGTSMVSGVSWRNESWRNPRSLRNVTS